MTRLLQPPAARLGAGLWLLLAACGAGDGGVDARPVRRVFATAASYDGAEVGGLAGGDVKCNHAALAGDLGGTWVAWLSDSSNDAIDRIPDVGPWFLVNGYTLVFPGKAQLAANPMAHLAMDEYGDVLDQDGQGRYVWTGTAEGGTRSEHCADWSDGTIDRSGTVGDVRAIDRGWTAVDAVEQESCGLWHHLYCFEQ